MRNASYFTVFLMAIGISYFAQGQPADLLSHIQMPNSQLVFEANEGQFASPIAYQCASGHTQVRFLPSGLSIVQVREKATGGHIDSDTHDEWENYRWYGEIEPHFEGLVWNLTFPGANADWAWRPYREVPGQLHYLTHSQGATTVGRSAEVWAEDLYPNIDLRYYGASDHQLKYDLVLHPGADITDVRFKAHGIGGLKIEADGSMTIGTQWGNLTEAKPFAYQVVRGQRWEVPSQYVMYDDSTFGFSVGTLYDASLPLIVDPLTLSWSTFFHTSLSDDYVIATYQDEQGSIYMTGYCKAVDFPVTPGVYQTNIGGDLDVYVTKLNPGGSSLAWSTFLGGTSWEIGYGIAVTQAGEVVVAGFSQSADFPTAGSGLQAGRGGGSSDGFVAKLSANGDSLLFSSYLGGTDTDYIYDLRLGLDESIYLAGLTQSADFPATAGAYSTTLSGSGDGFAAHISADGSSLRYATYLGGVNFDVINALAVEADGEVWVAGYTSSADYPVTADAYQNDFRTSLYGNQDGFFAKLSTNGSSLLYSTYLGGDRPDDLQGLTLAPNGDLVMGGFTYALDWPTTPNAVATTLTADHGYGEATLARFDSTGTQLLYSTLLGGQYMDYVKSVQVKDTHEVYLLGATQSLNFPISAGSQGHGGGYDAFLSIIHTQSGALMESSLLGGALNDYPRSNGAMRIDSTAATLAITSHSAGMPTTGNPLQPAKLNGTNDAPWIGSVQYDIILPVEVQTLSAVLTSDGTAEIRWQQELERPVTYTLARQAEGEDWQPLETVQGQQGLNSHQVIDTELAPYAGQKIYYRLRVVDSEGHSSQGRTIVLAIPSRPTPVWTLSPNPAYRQVHLTWEGGAAEAGQVTIRDLLGRTLYQQPKPAGVTQLEIRTDSWRAGLYWVQYSTMVHPLQQQTLQVY